MSFQERVSETGEDVQVFLGVACLEGQRQEGVKGREEELVGCLAGRGESEEGELGRNVETLGGEGGTVQVLGGEETDQEESLLRVDTVLVLVVLRHSVLVGVGLSD